MTAWDAHQLPMLICDCNIHFFLNLEKRKLQEGRVEKWDHLAPTNVAPSVILEGEDYGLEVSTNDQAHGQQ